MSITAGRALLAVGALGVLCVQPGGWSLGMAPGLAEFRSPHLSAPFFVLCLALLLVKLDTDRRPGVSTRSVGILVAGATLYGAGSLLQFFAPGLAVLLPLGALLACAGAATGPAAAGPEGSSLNRALQAVIAAGLGLEVLLALNAAVELATLKEWLGGENELRQRLLRLARVAAVILPILALLAAELRSRCLLEGRPATVSRWLAVGLALGAAGMPLVLMLAATVDFRLKYLLPVPADLVLAGTINGVWLAFRGGSPHERAGWLLIAASMTAGMAMGGYSFDGPLPSPLGTYTASVRTLMRGWHAIAIILGIALLLLPNRKPGCRIMGPT